MIVQNKKITLTLDESGNCLVHPTARRTIAVLEDAHDTVTFIADGSDSVVGDELILVVKKLVDAEWGFLFLADNNFVFTSCREVDDEVFPPGGSSWIGHFFFDGNKFLDTYEDC